MITFYATPTSKRRVINDDKILWNASLSIWTPIFISTKCMHTGVNFDYFDHLRLPKLTLGKLSRTNPVHIWQHIPRLWWFAIISRTWMLWPSNWEIASIWQFTGSHRGSKRSLNQISQSKVPSSCCRLWTQFRRKLFELLYLRFCGTGNMIFAQWTLPTCSDLSILIFCLQTPSSAKVPTIWMDTCEFL